MYVVFWLQRDGKKQQCLPGKKKKMINSTKHILAAYNIPKIQCNFRLNKAQS